MRTWLIPFAAGGLSAVALIVLYPAADLWRHVVAVGVIAAVVIVAWEIERKNG